MDLRLTQQPFGWGEGGRPSEAGALMRNREGKVFNRGMRLCWNGKYGGSGPTSVWDMEHGARPTRTLWAVPGGDTTGRAACQGSSL